jgi:hypothetical protein
LRDSSCKSQEPTVLIHQDVRHVARPSYDPQTLDFFGSLGLAKHQATGPRTIRQASPVCRRNWMASSEHLRVFIGNHITREPSGALRSQQPACRENFGSPTPRVTQPPGIFGCPPGHLRTPTGHLRTPTESSDSTGTFGFHRNLRVPPDLRVHLRSLGISTGCLSHA